MARPWKWSGTNQANTGPEITEYDVQYRKGSASYADDNCGSIQDDNCTGISGFTTNTTIMELEADTSYSVQVRAKNEEGASAWSRSVTVKTNKADNNAPTFDQVTLDRDVVENTSSGQDIGAPVTATDADADGEDRLTYSLEGPKANLFSINGNTGQIRTKSPLNYEDPACGYDSGDEPDSTTCMYTVRVKVSDRNGGSDAAVVTITVNDEDDENPSKPRAPRVTKTADSSRSPGK